MFILEVGKYVLHAVGSAHLDKDRLKPRECSFLESPHSSFGTATFLVSATLEATVWPSCAKLRTETRCALPLDAYHMDSGQARAKPWTCLFLGWPTKKAIFVFCGSRCFQLGDGLRYQAHVGADSDVVEAHFALQRRA